MDDTLVCFHVKTQISLFQFLPRDTMHKHGICRCAVAGCLSVTFVYCVETARGNRKSHPSFRMVPFSVISSDIGKLSSTWWRIYGVALEWSLNLTLTLTWLLVLKLFSREMYKAHVSQLPGAATWRIKQHGPSTVVDLSWTFHNDGRNRFCRATLPSQVT